MKLHVYRAKVDNVKSEK